MKKFLLGLTVMALIFMVGGIAYAGSTATQTFNVQISEINELTVSGNPPGLTVSTDSGGYAGDNPGADSDNSTTYAITTNGTSKKLTAQITTGGAMPTNIWLSATLVPAMGATSKGKTNLLSASAVDLVTGIATVTDGTSNTITYNLEAAAAAGTYTQTSKTITFTLCAQ